MFPGDVDAYLDNVDERREHDRRVNAATMTKRKQLETFIAKNRANAATASQARSKAKLLEKLDAGRSRRRRGDRAIQLPRGRSRGKAPPCGPSGWRSAIPTATSPSDVQLEIEHGSAHRRRRRQRPRQDDVPADDLRFARTDRPATLKWGYGCQVGVYAQHVYTTLPENDTVEDYLYRQAAPGRTMQQIKDVAGSFLFRGELIEKKIKVLSGGERARLVLAGLLLEQHNVLVLDEPGNHLDVETVEALADALCRYKARSSSRATTVTSCSASRRRSSKSPAAASPATPAATKTTSTASTRNSKPASAPSTPPTTPAPPPSPPASPLQRREPARQAKLSGREERELEKRVKAIERKIAKLDDEKKELTAS